MNLSAMKMAKDLAGLKSHMRRVSRAMVAYTGPEAAEIQLHAKELRRASEIAEGWEEELTQVARK